MPTYQYVCDACDHTFEELQSFSDAVLTKCPECGKKKLRRLFGTGAAILFKGSGFYETDYRSESYKSAAKADAPKTETDKGGESGKSDKGAAKTESASSGKSSKSSG